MTIRYGYTGDEKSSAHRALVSYLEKNDLLKISEVVSFERSSHMIKALSGSEINKAIFITSDTMNGRLEKNFDSLYENRFFVNGEVSILSQGEEVSCNIIDNEGLQKEILINFFIISKAPDVPKKKDGANYHTLIAITPHNDRPGLLRDISSVVGIYNVNMTDIFSRPALETTSDKVDSKMFYIIMEGHIMDDTFQTHILDGIKNILGHSETQRSFRFLGCYETAKE